MSDDPLGRDFPGMDAVLSAAPIPFFDFTVMQPAESTTFSISPDLAQWPTYDATQAVDPDISNEVSMLCALAPPNLITTESDALSCAPAAGTTCVIAALDSIVPIPLDDTFFRTPLTTPDTLGVSTTADSLASTTSSPIEDQRSAILAPESASHSDGAPSPTGAPDSVGLVRAEVSLAGLPNWLSEHYQRLTQIDVGGDLQEEWEVMLGNWISLERVLEGSDVVRPSSTDSLTFH